MQINNLNSVLYLWFSFDFDIFWWRWIGWCFRARISSHLGREACSWMIQCVKRNILAYRSDEMDDTAIWLNDPPNHLQITFTRGWGCQHKIAVSRPGSSDETSGPSLGDQVAASKMICAQTTRSLEVFLHEFEASKFPIWYLSDGGVARVQQVWFSF